MYKEVLARIYHYVTGYYVLSFPKCGRTWFRFMLGNALTNHFGVHTASLNDVLMVKNLYRHNRKIPRIHFSHDDLPNWKWVDQIQSDKKFYRRKKVIFLIRDPRDLVVSNFYEKKYRGFKPRKGYDKKNFEGTISEFIRYEFGGLPNIVRYYNVWQQQMNVPRGFLMVRYEDLKSKPESVLEETLTFLGIRGIDPATLQQAIASSSFENMRKIEESDQLDNYRLGSAGGNNTSFKTRKGKVGSFREELSEEDITWMEQYIDQHLHSYYSFYKTASVRIPEEI